MEHSEEFIATNATKKDDRAEDQEGTSEEEEDTNLQIIKTRLIGGFYFNIFQ